MRLGSALHKSRSFAARTTACALAVCAALACGSAIAYGVSTPEITVKKIYEGEQSPSGTLHWRGGAITSESVPALGNDKFERAYSPYQDKNGKSWKAPVSALNVLRDNSRYAAVTLPGMDNTLYGQPLHLATLSENAGVYFEFMDMSQVYKVSVQEQGKPAGAAYHLSDEGVYFNRSESPRVSLKIEAPRGYSPEVKLGQVVQTPVENPSTESTVKLNYLITVTGDNHDIVINYKRVANYTVSMKNSFVEYSEDPRDKYSFTKYDLDRPNQTFSARTLTVAPQQNASFTISQNAVAWFYGRPERNSFFNTNISQRIITSLTLNGQPISLPVFNPTYQNITDDGTYNTYLNAIKRKFVNNDNYKTVTKFTTGSLAGLTATVSFAGVRSNFDPVTSFFSLGDLVNYGNEFMVDYKVELSNVQSDIEVGGTYGSTAQSYLINAGQDKGVESVSLSQVQDRLPELLRVSGGSARRQPRLGQVYGGKYP